VFIWTSAPDATRSTAVSRKVWTPVAVSSASTSVSVLSAPRSKIRKATSMALSVSQKAPHWGAFFVVWMLAGLALADNCSQPGAGDPVVSRYVIDGDTLELVDGRRVRLIGINAPEIGRRGKPSEPYAQKARVELERLAGESGLRLVVGVEPKDRYGRTLGHLFDARGANIEG